MFDDDDDGKMEEGLEAVADDGRGFPIRKEGESELSARYPFPVSLFSFFLDWRRRMDTTTRSPLPCLVKEACCSLIMLAKVAIRLIR